MSHYQRPSPHACETRESARSPTLPAHEPSKDQLEEAALERRRDGLNTIAGAKLCYGVFDVLADRFWGTAQYYGDLVASFASCTPYQTLLFTLREHDFRRDLDLSFKAATE